MILMIDSDDDDFDDDSGSTDETHSNFTSGSTEAYINLSQQNISI